MIRNSTIANTSKHTAAGLLLTLPALTAAACYAHGHGALGGVALGIIVSLAIAAGAWGAGLLLHKNRIRGQRHQDLVLHLLR